MLKEHLSFSFALWQRQKAKNLLPLQRYQNPDHPAEW
jgi:hypothetical protein